MQRYVAIRKLRGDVRTTPLETQVHRSDAAVSEVRLVPMEVPPQKKQRWFDPDLGPITAGETKRSAISWHTLAMAVPPSTCHSG